MGEFTPDYAVDNDLPEGFNDLPVTERAAFLAERVRLLHIYSQEVWHDQALIVGNKNGLTVLRDAISAALVDGKAETTAMVSDGEGFAAVVELDDRPWEHPSWETRSLPYTHPMANGGEDLTWRISELESALRKANTALVKRGVKPIETPEPA